MIGGVCDHDGQIELLVLLDEPLRRHFVYVDTRAGVHVVIRIQIERLRVVVLLPFRGRTGGEFWAGDAGRDERAG